MLKINAAQFSAFADNARATFIKQAVARLANTAKTKNPDQLRAFVIAGIERAGKLAITSERDVFSLMELELQYGQEFWRNRPDVAEVLEQSTVSADIRIHEVRKRLTSANPSAGHAARTGT